MGAYADAHAKSLADPTAFWGEQAKRIEWITEPTKILDTDHKVGETPFYRWFSDGVMNTSYNALDRHVLDGLGDQVALIYDSPVTDTIKQYTYAELNQEVARLAGAMRQKR